MTRRRSRTAFILLRMVAASALAAAIVTVLHARGWFDEVENLWVDFVGLMHAPGLSSQVVLVGITDADFLRLFGGTSPLDPDVLAQLIDHLDEHQPNAVVVDIQLQPAANDTGKRLQGRHRLYDTLARVARGSTRWIVAHSDPPADERASWDTDLRAQWEQLEQSRADDRQALQWASADIELERGLVRHMRAISEEQWGGASLHTLYGAVAASVELPNEHPLAARRDANLLIGYTYGFDIDGTNLHAISVGDVLAATPQHPTSVLARKIVVLGGVHREGRDTYGTPAGQMPAAAIWSEAVDTFIRGDTPAPIGHLAAFAIETILGACGGGLMFFFGPVVGWLMAVSMLVLFTVVATWASFAWGFALVSSIPSFWAAQWHQRLELWLENRALHRQVREIRPAPKR